MESSTEIIVTFVLKTGEGNWPESRDLSDDELASLRSIAILFLDLDGFEGEAIESVDVIYDGITWLEDLKLGMHIEGKKISGFPSPVLRFWVKGEVSADELLSAVGFTSVLLQPSSFDETGEAPFICEDQDGDSRIISTAEALAIEEAAERVGAVGCIGIRVQDLEDGIMISDLIQEDSI